MQLHYFFFLKRASQSKYVSNSTKLGFAPVCTLRIMEENDELVDYLKEAGNL